MVESSDKFRAAFNEFNKSMVEEIERQIQHQGEKLAWQIEEYIKLSEKVKAKSVIVTRELAEMGDLFKAFQKKHEENGKTVFKKSLQFYLDALNTFDYKEIKAALDEELDSMKKEIQQTNLLIEQKAK